MSSVSLKDLIFSSADITEGTSKASSPVSCTSYWMRLCFLESFPQIGSFLEIVEGLQPYMTHVDAAIRARGK